MLLCACVCVCMCTCAHMYACVCACMCAHALVCGCMCMHVCDVRLPGPEGQDNGSLAWVWSLGIWVYWGMGSALVSGDVVCPGVWGLPF